MKRPQEVDACPFPAPYVAFIDCQPMADSQDAHVHCRSLGVPTHVLSPFATQSRAITVHLSIYCYPFLVTAKDECQRWSCNRS
mmetsp:Transcript_47728/g.85232  ORF Transcript_47728/g.85232 Transcript_47728/m.85232 type:complete len:83 (+) Transcript_47728:501-749(+)